MARGEVVTPEMPDAFAPYAALLFSRFPEVLLALGHPSLSKDFELPPSANSCTVIEETGEYKLVQVVLGRYGVDARWARSAVRPRRSTGSKASVHRPELDRTKKSPASDGINKTVSGADCQSVSSSHGSGLSRGSGRRSRKSAGTKTEVAAAINNDDSIPDGFWGQSAASSHQGVSAKPLGTRGGASVGGHEAGEALDSATRNHGKPRLGRIFRATPDVPETSEVVAAPAVEAAPAPAAVAAKEEHPVLAAFAGECDAALQDHHIAEGSTHYHKGSPCEVFSGALSDTILSAAQEEMRREEAALILKANRRHSLPSHSSRSDRRSQESRTRHMIYEPESPRSPGSFKPWEDVEPSAGPPAHDSKANKLLRGHAAQEASQVGSFLDERSFRSNSLCASPSFSLTNTEHTDEHPDAADAPSSLEGMSPFNSNKEEHAFSFPD
mmetsp:Transcript_51935/g.93377  ORF Transcript_51935/g.93377 Transcript_51935/m.93377 type:complete len:440 (+) Transcript_51935:85-1404(+)